MLDEDVVGDIAGVPPVGGLAVDLVGDDIPQRDAMTPVGDERPVVRAAGHDALDEGAVATHLGMVEVQGVAAEGLTNPETVEAHPADELRVLRADEHVGVAAVGPPDLDVAGEVDHLGGVASGHHRVGPGRGFGQCDRSTVDLGDRGLVEAGSEAGVVVDAILARRRARGDADLVTHPPSGCVLHLDRRRSRLDLTGGVGPTSAGRAFEIELASFHDPQPDVGRERLHAAAQERRFADAGELDDVVDVWRGRRHAQAARDHDVAGGGEHRRFRRAEVQLAFHGQAGDLDVAVDPHGDTGRDGDVGPVVRHPTIWPGISARPQRNRREVGWRRRIPDRSSGVHIARSGRASTIQRCVARGCLVRSRLVRVAGRAGGDQDDHGHQHRHQAHERVRPSTRRVQPVVSNARCAETHCSARLHPFLRSGRPVDRLEVPQRTEPRWYDLRVADWRR